MKLDDNYRIEKDKLSYQLIYSKTYTSEKGRNEGELITSEIPYYYPTLESTLRAYVNKAVDVSEDVTKLMEQLQELYNMIKSLYGK